MTPFATRGPQPAKFARAFRGLAGVNVIVTLLGFLTGPLQARELGPTGRGDLAAVLVVVGVAPWLLVLGMNAFVARETARQTERGALFGTVLVLSLVAALVGWAFAYPVAHSVAHGRDTVETLILIGFAVLPLSIGGTALMGALWDERNWRRFSAVRLLSFGLVAMGFVVLAASHRFTVASAAGVTFAAGVMSLAPLVPVLRRTRGWRLDRGLARAALSYGSRATLGDVANLSNLRLDQILMAGLVPARELGFYAVAVTAASFTAVLSQPLNLLVLPLVAGGDRGSVRRIMRITLLGVGVASGLLALATPWLVPLLFGRAFNASVGLVQVLVVGTTLLAGNGVLNAALNGDGRPGDTALAQGLGCAVTVPALILVLPRAGAMGAAVVSVASYGLVFAILLVRARQRLGGSLHEYVVPTAADVSALCRYARSQLAAASRAIVTVTSR